METNDILKELGRNIKTIRVQRGMTQQELTSLCYLETSNMCRIEAGRSNLTVGTLNKIATYLGIKIKDLFFNNWNPLYLQYKY